MKRRNADCGKIRRPIKRNKITEGMYGSTTVLYMKFLVLWAIVITADFMFMFRFEFLWPFWLLLRSVHDSFKYKGLAFSVLFVCIAITSDLVCLFFIPVHWLLFAASTYVWVQYVWHTDKGICLPTIILWMLFVYLEAGIRWKDSRHMPHLDLCRPFAAHCIGYPVVTLGFGFKSYVGYRMRQRKQREVAKENEFYMQLLQQALPQEDSQDDTLLTPSAGVTVTPVTTTAAMNSSQNNMPAQNGSVVSLSQIHQSNNDAQQHNHNNHNVLPTSLSATTSTSSVSSALASSATATSNDDKSYVQIAGQLHQQSGKNTSVHQQQNNNNIHLSASADKSAQTRSSTNGNSSNSGNSTSANTCTLNGHVNGGSNKNSRRSVEKDNVTTSSNRNNVTSGVNIGYHKDNLTSIARIAVNTDTNSAANHKDWCDNANGNSGNFSLASAAQKEKHSNNCDSSNLSSHQQNQLPSDSQYGCCGSAKKNLGSNSGNQSNGHIAQYEVEEMVEPIEKVKGRRNRSKKEALSKENHQNHHGSNNTNHANNQHNTNVTNSIHSHSTKDSNSETSSISSSASVASSTSPIANLASQVVSKICESCLKLEADVKKYRSEISHMKQIENELRQKLEANLTNKSYLQAKQKDCDELEKRIQELTVLRQHDIITLQNTERRLTEERRQKQSIEAQLNNEKKARKAAEDKANRPECSEACKQRKQQLEMELKQMRRDLKTAEDAKEMAQQQGRKFEQELRMFEVEIRNRDSQPGTDMLMSALAAMQDKNCTLEKNLSAETRVKLDLFSALGEAKRQLEIKDSLYRSKKEEVHDLKAKIAQLLAVMPTDSLCLPTCSNTGSSMLRMNDTPPLQGPSSPMMGIGPPPSHQQILTGHQLNQRVSNAAVNNNQQQQQQQQKKQQLQQQQMQQQQQQNVVVSQSSSVGVGVPVSQSGTSNLDPNASIYTPKNPNSMGSGNQAADA